MAATGNASDNLIVEDNTLGLDVLQLLLLTEMFRRRGNAKPDCRN